jgi:protein phosphatase
MTRVHFFALSERGIREINEDSFCAQRIGNYYVFGVADGLTGQAGGRAAGEIAIACLKEAFRDNPENPAMALESAVRSADAQVRLRAEKSGERSGAATKLIAAAVDDRLACTVLDVDGRSIDILNAGGIKTPNDPPALKKSARPGTAPSGTSRPHALSNMISHVLGEPHMLDKTDFREVNIRDSFLLLSSDGLHDYVGKDAIREILKKNGDNLEAACEELVQKALAADSDGTITVVLVHGRGN